MEKIMSTTKKNIQVFVCDHYRHVCDELTEKILSISKVAIQNKGRFNMALAGGTTPKGVYMRMADKDYQKKFAWHQMHFFWGDERWVHIGDIRNNYRMVAEALLTKVDIPIENIHPITTKEETPEHSAVLYEKELTAHFNLKKGEFPEFDLILLGLGPDAHVASLFPGNSVLKEEKRLAVPVIEKEIEEPRVTLTFPVINHAKHVIFMVTGMDKANALHMVFETKPKEPLPAQMVFPVNGYLTWFVDKPAISKVSINFSDDSEKR